MNKPDSLSIPGKTMPFIGVSFPVHVAVALIAWLLFVIIMGIGLLLSSEDNSTPTGITFIAALIVIDVLYRVKGYIIYLVKVAFVVLIGRFVIFIVVPLLVSAIAKSTAVVIIIAALILAYLISWHPMIYIRNFKVFPPGLRL